MSLEWHERVPKSKDRDALLAGMGEGKYLGILRKAALRHHNEDEVRSKALQQSALADSLHTKIQYLRDMEAGIRTAPLVVCEAYCKVMGLPITVLRKAGKGKLLWNGDTPSDPPKEVAPPKPPRPPIPARAYKSEEEKGRQRVIRAENRVLEGADLEVDLDKVTSITVRNQLEESVVLTFKVTPKGNLFVDVHQDCLATGPTEILKEGFTGVRVACPPVLEWDVGNKQKKVFDINVPTKRKD